MPTQQATAGTPQTPSHPGNPGNHSRDDPGDDLGDDPFNDNDNGNNDNNVDKATTCDEESSASSVKTRVCEPDPFNSTDPKKLCTNFQDCPCIFHLNCSKITFSQSYLKDMALEWFKPDLLSSSDPEDHPLWMDNWKEFIIELQSMFSPHNLVAHAENQLNHLQMKDVHGYGDSALCHYFYSGLPNHTKNEICQVGKPQALDNLQHLTQEINVHYWECKEEIQQANKHQTSPQNPSNKSSSSTPNSCHAPFFSVHLCHLHVTLAH
ncbi:hypothetical protein ID866_8340 [Astraeus odoratus]|nr:hypothetical protein ID866_8340 [Astraeus odoratus]